MCFQMVLHFLAFQEDFKIGIVQNIYIYFFDTANYNFLSKCVRIVVLNGTLWVPQRHHCINQNNSIWSPVIEIEKKKNTKTSFTYFTVSISSPYSLYVLSVTNVVESLTE